MARSVQQRVEQRRQALRDAGLRPIQIWVPDSRAPGFEEACRAQSLLVAKADAADAELGAFLDAAMDDIANSK